MKLRIQDNSVRLRLTRTEVERLDEQGEVTAFAAFPGGQTLRYAVKRGESGSVGARFEAHAIVITIPPAEVHDWATSDRVSIQDSEPLAGGDSLAILVEKDFACLKPREGEDESDMFTHPREGRETC
jgi:hypothetical protein